MCSSLSFPRRLALQLFSSSGLWNLLQVLSPQDEESICHPSNQAPKQPPSACTGQLALSSVNSLVTAALSANRQ